MGILYLALPQDLHLHSLHTELQFHLPTGSMLHVAAPLVRGPS